MPSVFPRSITARATVASVGLLVIRATKEWSSLTISTGRSRSALSGAGLRDDPSLQGQDQSGLIGQWDEVGRRDHPTARMAPAHECLKTEDRAIGDPDRGLVMQDQLPAFDGVRQVDFHFHAIADAGMLLGRIL